MRLVEIAGLIFFLRGVENHLYFVNQDVYVWTGVVQGSQENGMLGKRQRFTRKFGGRRRSRGRRMSLRLLAGHRVVAGREPECSQRGNSGAAPPAQSARSPPRVGQVLLANDPQLHGLRPSLRRAILLRRILRRNFGSSASLIQRGAASFAPLKGQRESYELPTSGSMALPYQPLS